MNTAAHYEINTGRYRLVRNVLLLWITAVLVAAFLVPIPRMNILEHTARNLYFHVPMWFVLMAGWIFLPADAANSGCRTSARSTGRISVPFAR